MRLSIGGLEDYVARVAELLERYGVGLDLDPSESLRIAESPSGALSFSLRGFLPDGRMPPLSVLEVREVWRRLTDSQVERWEYEYELVDHERGLRRAFHMHHRDDFLRRYQVAVHEHCEHPIGVAPCGHVFGFPVRDAFRGVEAVVSAWVDPEVPTCAALPCLD